MTQPQGVTGRRTPLVSIVVPVYNPGSWIEPCIRSILGQTLPRSELEAIFVDDGSTDGTAERLDRLAGDEPGVTVIHTPPSGAPGRPRNIGMAAAHGTYIQFLDADDELAPDALERLVAMARRNHSDIVVGRFVSAGHRFNQRLFDRSIDSCTLETAPGLVNGPFHVGRLFRTDFLREHGITFPEGWRKSEDQAFCLTAYFRAGVISVLGDGKPCYRYGTRPDAGNISAEPTDQDAFSANLEALMDIVIAGTHPGTLRTRIIRRIYSNEVLGQFREPTISSIDGQASAAVLAWAGRFIRAHVDEAVEHWYLAVDRVRTELIRSGRSEQLRSLAQLEERQVVEAATNEAHWAGGRLHLAGRAWLAGAGGSEDSVRVFSRGRSWFLDPRCAEDLGLPPVDVSRELAGRAADVYLLDPATGLERPLDANRRPDLVRDDLQRDTAGFVPAIRLGAILDPLRVGAGGFQLGPGAWELWLAHSFFGIGRRARLRPAPGLALPGPAIVGDPPRIVVPVVDDEGLSIDVDRTATSLAAALTGRPVSLLRDGDRLVLGLDVATAPGAGILPAELVLRAGARNHVLAAVLRPSRGAVRLEANARQRGTARVAAGSYGLVARLDGPAGPELPVGKAKVATDGRIIITGPTRIAATVQRRETVSWATVQTRRSLMIAVDRMRTRLEWVARSRARRLPEPIQRRLRAFYSPTGRA